MSTGVRSISYYGDKQITSFSSFYFFQPVKAMYHQLTVDRGGDREDLKILGKD